MKRFKWFSDVHTAEECKKRFRQLCKDYHPDNFAKGDAIFKEVQAEFSVAWEYFKNKHDTTETSEKTEENNVPETSEFLIKIISRIATFSGIEIEFCGSWIWLSGNTYPYREELVKIGFKWSKSKKKWYIAEHLSNKKFKKGQSMEKIRQKYGSKFVKGNGLFIENA